MRKEKKIDILIICTLYIIVCILLYWFQNKVIGYAVVDESAYVKLARTLHTQGVFNSSQYNILYVFVISLAFFAEKMTQTYDIIKVLNVLLSASCIFPAFLISKKLIKNRFVCYGLALVIGILPCSATTLVIWAEPLFYVLSLWAALCFFNYIDNKSVGNIIKLGLFCLLLYLTKQSGLVFVIAVELAIIYDYLINKKDLKQQIISCIANVLPILLFMFWNKIKGQSAMGYSSELESYTKVFSAPWALIKLFLYQFSDVMLMSFLVFGVIFVMATLQTSREKKVESPKYIMIALWAVGIMLLSALHRMQTYLELFEDSPLVYSRYTCVVIPFIFIFAVKQIMEKKIEIKKFILITAISIIICILFPPLESAVYAYGYISDFGLAYMNSIIYGYNRIMWGKQEVSIIYEIIPIICFVILGALILSNKKSLKMIAISLFAVLSIYTGIESTRLVYRVSRGQGNINQVYRFLIDSDIDKDEVYIDELDNGEIPQLNTFWLGGEPLDEQKSAKYIVTMEEYDYELIFSLNQYKIYEVRP